jgi:rod shape-determining protein MreD
MRGLLGALLLGTLVLLLRSTALSALGVPWVLFDALAVAVAAWALCNGEGWGSSFGFALGLAADLDAGHWLGRHALALALLGYVLGRLSRTLVRESVRTQLVVFAVATAAHQAWAVAFEIGNVAGWPHLLMRVVLGTLTTAPLGTLLLAAAYHLSGRSLFGDASARSRPAA